MTPKNKGTSQQYLAELIREEKAALLQSMERDPVKAAEGEKRVRRIKALRCIVKRFAGGRIETADGRKLNQADPEYKSN